MKAIVSAAAETDFDAPAGARLQDPCGGLGLRRDGKDWTLRVNTIDA